MASMEDTGHVAVLYYWSEWERPELHVCVDGDHARWRVLEMQPTPRRCWSHARIAIDVNGNPVTDSAAPQQTRSGAPSSSDVSQKKNGKIIRSLEFCIGSNRQLTKGPQKWDNKDQHPGRNYYISLSSNDYHASETGEKQARITLVDGELTRVCGPPLFLVADVDGTFVGDDAAMHEFQNIWLRQFTWRESVLVFNTGRTLTSFLTIAKEKNLICPDYAICGVGTEIYRFGYVDNFTTESSPIVAADKIGDTLQKLLGDLVKNDTNAENEMDSRRQTAQPTSHNDPASFPPSYSTLRGHTTSSSRTQLPQFDPTFTRSRTSNASPTNRASNSPSSAHSVAAGPADIAIIKQQLQEAGILSKNAQPRLTPAEVAAAVGDLDERPACGPWWCPHRDLAAYDVAWLNMMQQAFARRRAMSICDQLVGSLAVVGNPLYDPFRISMVGTEEAVRLNGIIGAALKTRPGTPLASGKLAVVEKSGGAQDITGCGFPPFSSLATSSFETEAQAGIAHSMAASSSLEKTDPLSGWISLFEGFNVAISGTGDVRLIDILPREAGKLRPLIRVMDGCGFARNEVVVCGDSGNDVEMFSDPDIRGIAVANSQRELLQFLSGDPDCYAARKGLRPTSQVFFATKNCCGGILEGLREFGYCD